MFRANVARAYACVCVLLWLPTPSVHAATISVPAGGDLQAALDAAQPGDEVLLARGATYVGNFRLPLKPGATFIVVRTEGGPPDLPAPGVRTSPVFAALLAKIKSPNTAPALMASNGSHHWRIENVEFQANANGAGDIIVLGGSPQTEIAQMPYSIVLDRLYIHGDPVVGQKRGVALNSGATEVLNSYISDIKLPSQDSQAIAGWNGSGPYLIQNNYLEAASENVLFGGADPSIPDLVPSDITIRGNLMSKPLQWRLERWQIKNSFELKNARRVLIEGNVFENVWVAAQAGFAILLSTRNQNGRAPWSVVEDVTFRYNVVRHAANGINISGYDTDQASQQGKRYRISHNLFHDIDGSQWGGSGIFLQLGNEPRDVIVEHNTVLHSGVVVSVYGSRRDPNAPVDTFLFRDNFMRHNTYGVKGQSTGMGQATLDRFFRNVTFDRNVLAGGDPSKYPAGNYFPTMAEFEGSFPNAAASDYRLAPDSSYATAASDGTALGADIARVNAVVGGGAPPDAPADPGVDLGVAVCRPGRLCVDRNAPSRRSGVR